MKSPFATAAFPHGQLLPESGLLGRRVRLYGRLFAFLFFQHVEQIGFDAGFVCVQLNVVPLLSRVGRFLAVNESLLQIAHHLLADRLLHGQVLFNVLPVIVRLLLVVAYVITLIVVVGFVPMVAECVYQGWKKNTVIRDWAKKI